MKYTYGSGQRPLDGYTIKRGVGKGGFGEVYFAVSDGGKEVALKLVTHEGEVELRGIGQCLNLKHPNLVNLFDLRADRDGNSWVVMEYVAGESLHMVLNRHASGVPHELAREWFLQLSRAVGYLHDHGVVHRDLKPANIFVEDGVLKVGDFGLCKSISSSQRTAQTQSVGTVHYMAPEISTGNYSKAVDVYSCGVMLYELLTGKLPFEGETAGEILMKHLTSTPDLSPLPEAYRPIIGRALAKNPLQRFESMAEMARAVEASSSAPRPVAATPAGTGFAGANVPPPPLPNMYRAPLPRVLPVAVPATPPPPASVRGKIGELSGSLSLAALYALPTTVLWAALVQEGTWEWLGSLYFLTVAASWAVLLPAKFWDKPAEDTWVRRIVLMASGTAVGLFSMWLEGWSPHTIGLSPATTKLLSVDGEVFLAGAGSVSFFGLVFGVLRWWKLAERSRKRWFALMPVFGTGLWAMMLWPVLLQDQHPHGVIAVVTAAAIVQWASAWQEPPPSLPRRVRLRNS